MMRHYKAMAVCLLVVSLLCIGAVVLRDHIEITPAVHIDYEDLVTLYAEQYGLEDELVFAVIKVESNFEADALSSKKAYGLMQITEETLNWAIFREGKNTAHTAEDLYDPEVNIKYGCLILSLLLNEFGDVDTALAAYNAGRGNVLNWLKDSRYSADGITIQKTPYSETNQYIIKVNKYRKQYGEMLGETA